MTYTIITENDKSEWKDETGEVYHFPKRYLTLLPEGGKVIVSTRPRASLGFLG